ncbi:MAG: BLUF domain-containing protein [Phycisphaerae bacterium]|nr:BLUF domain-containing protein [Phycisphaerales bacterium]
MRACQCHREGVEQVSDSLVHLIYASAATEPFSDEALLELLAKARRNNASLGVTGMLLYSEGSFFQVLEGEENVVRDLFRTICKDKRHTQVTEIIFEPIGQRIFGEWSMSFASMTHDELLDAPGLNDAVKGGESLLQLTKGRAKKLAVAFVEGRWRTKLVGQ